MIQKSPKHHEKEPGISILENALLHAFPVRGTTESMARTRQMEESCKAVR